MSSVNTTAVYDVTSMPDDESLKIVRTTVLLFFLLLSLMGNSLVVFAICVSSKRSCRPINAYLLSMAAFGLLECSLSMPFATGFSLEGEWIFGDFLKGFNACFVQLQNVGLLLTLTAMSIDRYVAVKHQLAYKREPSIHRANYIVLYTWIHAFVISLPLLFHNESLGLKVCGYIERCLCGLSSETTIIYTIMLTVTSYGLPFFIATGFFITIFTTFATERKFMRRSNTANYANYCLQESQLFTEMKYARYVLLLFFLYLLLKGPYVVIDVLTQFNVQGAYVGMVANTSGNTSAIIEQASGNNFYYQTAFTWAMFCFSAMYPLVTFASFAEHKRRLRIHLCCAGDQVPSRERNTRNEKSRRFRNQYFNNRNNNNGRVKNGTDEYGRRQKKDLENRKNNSKPGLFGTSRISVGRVTAKQPKPKGLHVPVLYAAADGLHLASTKSPTRTSHLDRNTKASGPEERKEPRPGTTNGAVGRAANSLQNAGKEFGGQTIACVQKTTKGLMTLNPAELVKCLKKVGANGHTTNIAIESTQLDPKEATFENRSIVDQRIDVLGSTDGLQSEEENYLYYAGSEFEDETDSELNESANSRTLILPIRGMAATKKTGWVRNTSISPLPLQKTAQKYQGMIPKSSQKKLSESSVSLPGLFHHTKSTLSMHPTLDVEHDVMVFSSNTGLHQAIVCNDFSEPVGASDTTTSVCINSNALLQSLSADEMIFIPVSGRSLEGESAAPRDDDGGMPNSRRCRADLTGEIVSGGASRLTLRRGSSLSFIPHQLP